MSDQNSFTDTFEIEDGVVLFDGAGLLASAQTSGASQAVLETISSGRISFEDYERALRASFACAREAGVDVNDMGIEVRSGVSYINYSIAAAADGLTEERILNYWDLCYAQHAEVVDRIWQIANDPSNQTDLLDSKLASLSDCLRRNGNQVDDVRPETFSDAAKLAEQIAIDGGENCMQASGFIE